MIDKLTLDRYFAYSDGHIERDEAGDWVKWNELQAKIASGELMVVKTAKLVDTCTVDGLPVFECQNCGDEHPGFIDKDRHPSRQIQMHYCSGCGAKIIE